MPEKPNLPLDYVEALLMVCIFLALALASAVGAAFTIYVREESAYDLKVAQQTGDILVRLDRLERASGCGAPVPDER